MAEAAAPPVLTLKFPAGLNNRARESALPDGSLRTCQNLDVTREGTLLARKGLRLITTGDCHSFYAHPRGHYALLVKDGNLCHWDGTTFTVLRAMSTAPISYACLNDEVFFSDGLVQGRVTAAGTLEVWGISTPPEPVCGAITSGGFTAGIVRITITSLYGHLESGAPEPSAITVAEGGGVLVAVPQGTATFRVYATESNGEILREVGTVAAGGTLNVGAGNLGKPLESLFAVKPYPGQYLVAHKGRLWIASGSTLWFTDTLSPHWLVPHEGYYQFESTITLLGAAEDGLYVGTSSRVYFLQGNKPTDLTQRPVLHLGAVPGSGLNDIPVDVMLGQGIVPTRCCAFLDTEGAFCLGRAGGMVQRVTADKYLAGNARKAEIGYWRQEGLRKFLVRLDDEADDGNVAGDVAVETVYAHGITL